MDSIVSPLWLCWVKRVCLSRNNLPTALLAEWLGSFMCHCSNMGLEWTPNKSQHGKWTLEKEILLPPLPGIKPMTFWSQVWHSTNWAILTPLASAGGDCKMKRLIHRSQRKRRQKKNYTTDLNYRTLPQFLITCILNLQGVKCESSKSLSLLQYVNCEPV